MNDIKTLNNSQCLHHCLNVSISAVQIRMPSQSFQTKTEFVSFPSFSVLGAKNAKVVWTEEQFKTKYTSGSGLLEIKVQYILEQG